MRRYQTEPEWVLVNAILRNVSEFGHLPPSDRPKAVCPLCNTTAIFKLGKKNVHHYAHAIPVECTANHPETALHLNTKFHIYRELVKGMQNGLSLKVTTYCSGDCRRSREHTWASGWDDVQVETSIDPIRPDIVIFKGGLSIGAIEVCASNAVSENKTIQFADKGLQWIEVQADERIYSGASIWLLYHPLPYIRLGHASYSWKCEHCISYKKQMEIVKSDEAKRVKDISDAKRAAFLNPPNQIKRLTNKTPWHYFEFTTENRPQLTCILCGKLTGDWFDREADGIHCRCRPCLHHFFPSGGLSHIVPDDGAHHISSKDDSVPF